MRLAILLHCIDQLQIHYGEEEIRGTIAREIIHGLRMPFFNYRADNYSGGSLVVGIISVPFFIFFGENLIALKLTALLIFTLSLILLYLFCEKFFNRRVAVITSLLFILSPKIFTAYSLVTMGFHSESIIFSIMLIFLFFQIFYNQKSNPIYLFLLGLVGGFGLWFTYIFSITLITCLLFWFSFERRFIFKKEFYIFLTGFLIGFSPWLWFNFTHNFSGMDVVSGGFNVALGGHEFFFHKFKDIIRALVSKENGVWDSLLFLNLSYFLVCFIFFCYLLAREKNSLSRLVSRILCLKSVPTFNLREAKYCFFLVYCMIFGLVYFFSNYPAGRRFLIPLFPYAFVIVSLSLDRIWNNKIKNVNASFVIIAFLISVGAINQSELFLKSCSFGKGWGYKGYSYPNLAGSLFFCNKFCYLSDPLPEYWIDLIKQLNAEDKEAFYENLVGFIDIGFQEQNQNVEKCIEVISQKVEKKYQKPFYCKLGEEIAISVFPDEKKGLRLIDKVDNEYRQVAQAAFMNKILYLRDNIKIRK